MAEIINLRQARKEKQRRDKQAESEKNRKEHGLSKSIKSLAKKLNLKKDMSLDGKKFQGEKSDK